METPDYITSNGNEVKFGRRGWRYITKNVDWRILQKECDEIWEEWCRRG